MLNKVFGIPSWLPNEEHARVARIARLNRLLRRLEELWPDIDILIIAQNWQDFVPVSTVNKQIIRIYEPLGILGARKALREEFLKLDYDYIIMFDDDAIISFTDDSLPKKYMDELDKHPYGFCFIAGKNCEYHPYCGAQLNLCAISRFIYELEPMVNIDPQKNEGYEDSIYACLLYHKYNKYEFKPPKGIYCSQWLNRQEHIPSTWAEEKRPYYLISQNTNRIQAYIAKHKDFPKNYQEYIMKEPTPIKKLADGKLGYYLTF